nr:MAG TPA: NTP-PPase-like protein [Caudoviricetes sp.]
MRTIQELVPLIQEWAKEREIYEQLTPFDELLKTHEEVGELIKACYDNDRPAIQDAIGDVMVTLINYCYFKGVDFIPIIRKSLERPNTTRVSLWFIALQVDRSLNSLIFDEARNNVFDTLEYISFTLHYILRPLNSIALLEDTTLEECINIAYNEIKDRKGRIINRKFVKDEYRK